MAEDRADDEHYASLRDDGQVLWIDTREGARGIRLADPESLPEKVAQLPTASHRGGWSVFARRSFSDDWDRLLLQRGSGGKARVWITSENPVNTGVIEFSQDGRYLSWRRSQDCTIKVADLPALEHEVRAFEQSIFGK